MRAVVQRVARASVSVDCQVVGAIGPGLLVLLGVAVNDTESEALWLAHRVANLRVFSDVEGKMNLSVKDMAGEVLVVSQFTLIANTRKGFRPSFVSAAPPSVAEPLVACFVDGIRSEDVPAQTGLFGAHMQVDLRNDGPVTIVLEKGPGAD